jgi:hypothetical protein
MNMFTIGHYSRSWFSGNVIDQVTTGVYLQFYTVGLFGFICDIRQPGLL